VISGCIGSCSSLWGVVAFLCAVGVAFDVDVVSVGDVEVCLLVLDCSSLVDASAVVDSEDGFDCAVEMVESVEDAGAFSVVAGAVVSESCLRYTAARPTTISAQQSASKAAFRVPRTYIVAAALGKPKKTR